MTTAVMSAVARPLPGAGTLARAGDLVLVVGEGPGADQVLDLFEEAVGAGGDGGALVRRVAALLANDFDGRLPACAVAGWWPTAGWPCWSTARPRPRSKPRTAPPR